MEQFFGVPVPTGGRLSPYTRKLSKLWLVHNPEPLEEAYLNN
jgi:hypothetical protein